MRNTGFSKKQVKQLAQICKLVFYQVEQYFNEKRQDGKRPHSRPILEDGAAEQKIVGTEKKMREVETDLKKEKEKVAAL